MYNPIADIVTYFIANGFVSFVLPIAGIGILLVATIIEFEDI